MAKDEEADASKQNRRVLIRPQTFRQLQRLAERDEAEVAEMVNRACRELLKAEGLWPPVSDEVNDDRLR